MSRIVHFEIPAENAERAVKFYGDIFGWSFPPSGMDGYHLAITGPEGTPGINGAIMQRNDPAQPVTIIIGSDAIDASLKKVTDAGGTIVVPKLAIPGVGWVFYFKDTEGNIVGVWQDDKNAA